MCRYNLHETFINLFSHRLKNEEQVNLLIIIFEVSICTYVSAASTQPLHVDIYKYTFFLWVVVLKLYTNVLLIWYVYWFLIVYVIREVFIFDSYYFQYCFWLKIMQEYNTPEINTAACIRLSSLENKVIMNVPNKNSVVNKVKKVGIISCSACNIYICFLAGSKEIECYFKSDNIWSHWKPSTWTIYTPYAKGAREKIKRKNTNYNWYRANIGTLFDQTYGSIQV